VHYHNERLVEKSVKKKSFGWNNERRSESKRREKDGIIPEMKIAKTKTEKGTLSTTFQITKITSIPNDNVAHRVFIGDVQLECIFNHYVVPKLDPRAYVKLTTTNKSLYPFLKGPMSVFFDNTFVAKSTMPNVSQSEKFITYLGVDPNVKVEYKSPYKFSESKGLLGGTTQIKIVRKINIKNSSPNKIDLIVLDQLPLPVKQEIVVSLITPPPEITKVNSETNTRKVIQMQLESNINAKVKLNDQNNVEWELQLNSGGEINIPFQYTVAFPYSKKINSEI